MKQLLFLTLFVVLCQTKQIRLADTTDILLLKKLLLDPATKIVAIQCFVNSYPEVVEDIGNIAEDSYNCFMTPNVTKKDDLTKEKTLEYFEDCFQNLRTKIKKCFTETHQYLPDFLFDVGKNLVTELYERSFNTAYREAIVDCGKKQLDSSDANERRETRNCFKSLKEPIEILDSKEHVCRVSIPIFDCIGNRYRTLCGDNDNIVKYAKTFKNYVRKPCGQEELI